MSAVALDTLAATTAHVAVLEQEEMKLRDEKAKNLKMTNSWQKLNSLVKNWCHVQGEMGDANYSSAVGFLEAAISSTPSTNRHGLLI